MQRVSAAAASVAPVLFAAGAFAQERFPRPEFESEYQRPLTTVPSQHAAFFEVLDVALLTGALALASYLILKKRSRRGVFWLSVFSAAYFGFYRNGCVCAVGSLQNVSAAVFHPGFLLPASVLAFFVLPLVFALFFGRTFCSSVCPLGCMQDLVMLKPVKVPRWLSEVLGLFPYVYLGFAVLFAATGATFIICRYDPFVSIYRLTGDVATMAYSIGFVGLSVFIGRPYCRWLCPYGVLLGWMSALSKRHATITPTDCVQCRLCERACPFDYIDEPASGAIQEPATRARNRLAMLLLLLPVIIVAGGFSLSRLDVQLAKVHPTVRLAEEIRLEDSGLLSGSSVESRAFRSSTTPKEALFAEADRLLGQFRLGSWILGSFLGLIIGLKLIGFSVPRFRADYEINRTGCYSCARCFSSCPNEIVRLEGIKMDKLRYAANPEN